MNEHIIAQATEIDNSAPLLAHLHRGGPHWYLWRKSDVSDWQEVGGDMPETAGEADVYFSVHPLREIPTTDAGGVRSASTAVRGRIEHVATINALYADHDAKDFDPVLKALGDEQRTAEARQVGLTVFDILKGNQCAGF